MLRCLLSLARVAAGMVPVPTIASAEFPDLGEVVRSAYVASRELIFKFHTSYSDVWCVLSSRFSNEAICHARNGAQDDASTLRMPFSPLNFHWTK